MTTGTNKKQALNQQAFSFGWKQFFTGGPEFYPAEDRTEVWCKEYTRGWQQAYFKKQRGYQS